MAGKQWLVARYFRYSDPKTLIDSEHQVGELYTGKVEDIHISPDGPDGLGPLLIEKKFDPGAAVVEAPVSTSSSTKEK